MVFTRQDFHKKKMNYHLLLYVRAKIEISKLRRNQVVRRIELNKIKVSNWNRHIEY